ncbi:MAG: hypothetical protein M1825_003288 [Sarcosagium campestre]|nr:MAG: hypothetical protein M1825_003288 [Sarcosagium campestre]
MEPPAPFLTLSEALKRPAIGISVMGIVVDFRPPARSAGQDYVVTLTLSDQSVTGVGYRSGMRVRIFRPSSEELPTISNFGDMIIFRKINIKDYRGDILALSGRATEWTILPAGSVPATAEGSQKALPYIFGRRCPRPSAAEEAYLIQLYHLHDKSTFPAPDLPAGTVANPSHEPADSIAVVPFRKQKFSLIESVQALTFYDLVVEVVKTFSGGDDRHEIYVTDYTENDLLYNYEDPHASEKKTNDERTSRDGDEYGYIVSRQSSKSWPGPYGRRTLQVTLWPPHSYYSQENVKDGDYISLKNVQVAYPKDGSNRLEGRLHEDRKYQQRVDVSKLNHRGDELVRALIGRKREYSAALRTEEPQEDMDHQAQRTKRSNVLELEDLTKASEKGGRKRRQKGRKGVQAQDKVLLSEPSIESSTNKHVQAANFSVPLTPLSTILEGDQQVIETDMGNSYVLPFRNIRFFTRVQVVDFFPPNLEDFAVRESCRRDKSDLDPNRSLPTASGQESDVWRWRFCLIVEDGTPNSSIRRGVKKERVELLVADEDAEFLLKLEAVDLRVNPQRLSELREQLFVLWGDLEERAKSRSQPDPGIPSRKTFDCYIKEYGVEMDQVRPQLPNVTILPWERKFRLYGTTIKD